MTNRRFAALMFSFWAAASSASGCTLCHSPTALGVRHLLLHHDLARNAAAVMAPIAVLLAVIAAAAWAQGRRVQP